ncbi:MAG: hypothetical protein IH840_10565 [Candidatus Heimdallarchaeota archaeon]|nr:hypothetical protein [Candidatus Heimdallarchaeota archaeon]
MASLECVKPLKVVHPFKSIEFWDNHKLKIWGLGFLLRLLLIPFGLETTDYNRFRVPLARGLAEGGGLYNEVEYDQIPIYPYITAMMVLFLGTESQILTAIAIKLPIAIADGFVLIVLYKIGIRLDLRDEGLLSSLVYAVNPLTLRNGAKARWDGLMILTLLIAFYFMLQNHPYRFGFTVSTGCLIKVILIYLFGIALAYWKNDWLKLLKATLTFLLTTTALIAIVLIPFKTSLNQMYEGLASHLAYSIDETHAVVPDFIEYRNLFFNVKPILWVGVWAIVFFSLQVASLLAYYFNPEEKILIEIMTFQMTLLSLFFINMHDQFLVWLFPSLLLWSITKSGKTLYFPILITIGYFAYVLPTTIGERIGVIILGFTGVWIIYQLLKELINLHKSLGRNWNSETYSKF